MHTSIRTLLVPALLALLVAGCDLGTKSWIRNTLSSAPPTPRAACERRGESGPFVLTRNSDHVIELIGSNVELAYTENCVAAFSVFENASRGVRRVGLLLGSLAALVALFVMDRRLPTSRRLARAALGIVLGGAIGNLGERIVRGFVVDFIDVHVGRFHWPLFNVADIAITVGVALFVIENMFEERKPAPS